MSKTNLSIQENSKLIEDYISGMPKKDIAKKYDIPTRTVDTYVRRLPNELEKAGLDNKLQLARESGKIQSLKEEILELASVAISDAYAEENKLKYIDKISSLLERIDKIFRLNAGEPTEHKKETKTVIDVAEIIKQAKTPEDRLKILQGQFYDK